MRRLLAVLATLIAVAGCGSTGSVTSSLTDNEGPLEKAYAKCALKDGGDTLELGDDGSLSIDTGADGDIDGAVCVFIDIGTPDRVITRVDSTTALMGNQEVKADGLVYDWSYHPDNGMNMTIAKD